VECNEVAHVTPFEGAPSYAYDRKTGDFIVTVADEDPCFEDLHRRHTTEELFIIKDSFISEERYGEPLKVSYFEASNGRERFVIRGSRTDITRPITYELIPGYIETSFRREVQGREIRRQLDAEVQDPPFDEAKVSCFIHVVEQVAAQFPLKDRLEITAETDTPLISHCKLGPGDIREILNLCRGVFDGEELKRLETFIMNNNSYNEPMTLLLKRAFRIKRAGAQVRESTADEPRPASRAAAQHS
jgi:hypothetical protein